MRFGTFAKFTVIFTLLLGFVVGAIYAGITVSNNMIVSDTLPDDDGQQPDAEPLPPVNVKKEPINVLLLGSDNNSLTDTIMIIRYDPRDDKVDVLQIPRDTKVETSRYDKKINSAYAFGKEKELYKDIKNLLGLDIDRYLIVNLQGFRDIVDTVDGVEVDVPINMKYSDPAQNLYIDLKKGVQILDGKKAEMFVRFRRYAEGDEGRVKAQQQFIKALTAKCFSLKNVFNIPKILEIASKNFKTNFTVGEIKGYMQQALKLNTDNISMHILPGEGKFIGDISYYTVYQSEMLVMVNQYFK